MTRVYVYSDGVSFGLIIIYHQSSNCLEFDYIKKMLDFKQQFHQHLLSISRKFHKIIKISPTRQSLTKRITVMFITIVEVGCKHQNNTYISDFKRGYTKFKKLCSVSLLVFFKIRFHSIENWVCNNCVCSSGYPCQNLLKRS